MTDPAKAVERLEALIRSYKYRIKDRRARKVLRDYAWGANQVWNYCVAHQRDIEARYRAGAPKRRWPSHFDLTYLTAGVTNDLGINSGTVGEVCRQFAQSRNAAHRAPRFRASGGDKRSLGWVPFKKGCLRLDGNKATYRGRAFRVFGSRRRPLPVESRGGAFVEDAQGRWWLTLHVEVAATSPGVGEVGIDLGLKTLATCSDGAAIENLRHGQVWAAKLATAQRAGNKRRVSAIHAKIANARRDHQHKATTQLVRQNRFIVVGDVSPSKLAKTRMAKSVLDAGWSGFRNMLRYKSQQAQSTFLEVNERETTRTCSCCGTIPDSSPKGIGALGMRSWECSDCGAVHDRDVNAAINILRIGRSVAPRVDESRRAA